MFIKLVACLIGAAVFLLGLFAAIHSKYEIGRVIKYVSNYITYYLLLINNCLY